jgi:hypothetical protein
VARGRPTGAVTRVQILPAFMDVQKDGYPAFAADADAQKINPRFRLRRGHSRPRCKRRGGDFASPA